MNGIAELDHSLFSKINLDWTNAFFDWLFPSITDLHKSPLFVIALLLLLGLWIYKRRRVAAIWILTALISLAFADLLCYRVIKPLVDRPRPPDASIEVQLRTVNYSGPSFPSNHAANLFAVATTLSGSLPGLGPILFLFASLVAYSRIYVGVHFPLDVLAGAAIGTLIGMLVRLAMGRLARHFAQFSSRRTAEGREAKAKEYL